MIINEIIDFSYDKLTWQKIKKLNSLDFQYIIKMNLSMSWRYLSRKINWNVSRSPSIISSFKTEALIFDEKSAST